MVEEFIQRRFGEKDYNWKTGNCYYFAIILKTRFPEGDIYYDTIDGHFIFKLQDTFYDYTGAVNEFTDVNAVIKWDDFDKYDSLLKQRIIRDCIL